MKVQIPALLSHYTTLAGFIGIIESNRLWASNASFLNDKMELLHGLQAAQTAVNGKAKLAEDRWLAAMVEVLTELKNDGLLNTYISCFCPQSDVLSLWRGYGGGQQGISVTFEGIKLEKWLAKSKAEPSAVIYAKVSTVSKFRAELKKELKEEVEWEDLLGEEYTAEEVKKNVKKLMSKLLPRFKHLGFKDEREFRFVVHKRGNNEVKFRVKNSTIVPYVELGVGSIRLPITSVTIGPSSDMLLTKKSVEVFLRANGYQDVEVCTSEVPYRD